MTQHQNTQPNVQINDVIYNAANQCFEALVVIEQGSQSSKYPCAIEAPITMSFEQAAAGLTTQALRRHTQRFGLKSQMRSHAPAPRAGRQRFDPRTWLAQLGFGAANKAA